jgi:hypothetical protein
MVSFRIAVGPVSSRFHRAPFIRSGACLVALVMLLSAPLARSHDFTIHFRIREVARFVERHTFVSPMHGEAKFCLTMAEVEPILAFRTEPHSLEDHFEADVTARVSIVEALHRLKLGPHRESYSEPMV